MPNKKCPPTVMGLTLIKAIVYEEYYGGGVGVGDVVSYTRNSSLTKIANGRWRVLFDTPHPDGDKYHPSLTSQEELNLRDTPDILVTQGTKTATGFDIHINTGDNGGNADALVIAPWSWGVTAPIEVITGISGDNIIINT